MNTQPPISLDRRATDHTEPTYPQVERRQEMRLWRDHVDKRLDAGSATMRELREELALNTKATKQVHSDTSELVDLLKSFKGAFTVFDLIGRGAKPLGYIVGACTAAWVFVQTLKGGGVPK